MTISAFETQKLGPLCSKIGSGATPRGGSNVYLEQGKVSLIRSQNVKNAYFDKSGLVFIKDEHAKQLSNVSVEPGDVLLNITGDSVARCCQVISSVLPARVNQHVAIIRPDSDKLDASFLKYFMISPQMQEIMLGWAAAGGTRNALTKKMIESFEVPVPSLSEQRAISYILGSLDDKIELNRKMNQTLESMAQALFKSWFVDFDPVIDNALAAGNPIPEALAEKAALRESLGEARKPLPEEIRTLFPDSFASTTEMGWIPKGWEMQPLYELAKFINGAAYRKFHFTTEPGALPIIKIAEIKNGVSAQTNFTKTVLADKYRIKDGDILFSWSGNPDTSIDTFVWSGGPGWLNQHIFLVNLHARNDRNYVYYQLKTLRPIFAEIARNKQTTGLGHVTVEDMKRFFVFKCKTGILTKFNEYAGPLFDRWFANQLSIRNRSEIRDTLLPKLLSGEVRISDAEELMINKQQ